MSTITPEMGSRNSLEVQRIDEIPGLFLVNRPIKLDERGGFMESWHREKMVALGLPDFDPYQQNVSFNESANAIRGIHVEPWDKFVGPLKGKIFGAWVDLREGNTFGNVFTSYLDPGQSVFVPRGVGNAFATLEPDTIYSYLVTAHWKDEYPYPAVNLADPELAIPWPIDLNTASMSLKDRSLELTPNLASFTPYRPRKDLVLGANGQVGRALQRVLDNADFFTRVDMDITSGALERIDWNLYEHIINAAAYTKVDLAETPEGRKEAWEANAYAVARLAQLAGRYGKTLVHYSTDYIFDGNSVTYSEVDTPNPLSIYGQSKNAGDIAVQAIRRHYLIRTSWVVGEGGNFVKAMVARAANGLKTPVVNDQIGRLTFASEIASATKHLLESEAKFGTYNLSSEGPVRSWANIAKFIFEVAGVDPGLVIPVSARQYFASQQVTARRPDFSVLDMRKIKATGFEPQDWRVQLKAYVEKELRKT